MTNTEFLSSCELLKLLQELYTRKLLDREKLDKRIQSLVNELHKHLDSISE